MRGRQQMTQHVPSILVRFRLPVDGRQYLTIALDELPKHPAHLERTAVVLGHPTSHSLCMVSLYSEL
jgi:hypothetical protein